MQLGARWRTGDPPHRGVPVELYPAIAEQEAARPAASAWTLTWLEGRPRCQLDGGVVLTLGADGRPVIEAGDPEHPLDEDDDWLS